MQLLYICLFLLSVACNCTYGQQYTFKFGQNKGEVSFSVGGSIGFFEKTVKIPVVVPKCSRLNYVQVDIYNPFGPPMVQFDWDVNTAIVTYGALQSSVSKYVVIAKTTPTYCSQSDRDLIN
ncbi:uncharacterized protein [Epargyreus clarus]|uniref:uncharacterized protein n=1 Tax=Epargyreus clarus TaxID=520877 RepID=UPI003C2CE392